MADYNTGGKADDALLSDSDKRLISKLKAAYAKAATQTEKDSLHRQAEAIRAAYGYSGGTDGTQYISQDNGSLPQTQDYSEYIARARTQESDAAVDELKRQKKAAVAALDEEKAAIEPYYYDARNQAAAGSAQALRNFNEYASQKGLSSGAAAQAVLSQSGALTSQLGTLLSGQTQAYKDIELERSQTVEKYSQLISQAKAKGQAALADSLYEELVRRDKAALDRAVKQAQLNK